MLFVIFAPIAKLRRRGITGGLRCRLHARTCQATPRSQSVFSLLRRDVRLRDWLLRSRRGNGCRRGLSLLHGWLLLLHSISGVMLLLLMMLAFVHECGENAAGRTCRIELLARDDAEDAGCDCKSRRQGEEHRVRQYLIFQKLIAWTHAG